MSETGTVSTLYTQRARGKNHAKGTWKPGGTAWAILTCHSYYTKGVFRGFRSPEADEA